MLEDSFLPSATNLPNMKNIFLGDSYFSSMVLSELQWGFGNLSGFITGNVLTDDGEDWGKMK